MTGKELSCVEASLAPRHQFPHPGALSTHDQEPVIRRRRRIGRPAWRSDRASACPRLNPGAAPATMGAARRLIAELRPQSNRIPWPLVRCRRLRGSAIRVVGVYFINPSPVPPHSCCSAYVVVTRFDGKQGATHGPPEARKLAQTWVPLGYYERHHRQSAGNQPQFVARRSATSRSTRQRS
jgi:hypothetical protein